MFFEIVKNRKSWWGEFLKRKERLYRKDAPVVKGTSVRRHKILIPTPTTRPGAFISFAVIFWVVAPLLVTLRLLRHNGSAAPLTVFLLEK